MQEAFHQFPAAVMFLWKKTEDFSDPERGPAVSPSPALAVHAAGAFIAVKKQPRFVILQKPGVRQNLVGCLVEIFILAGYGSEPGEKGRFRVHAIDPDLLAPARQIAPVHPCPV